MKLEKGLVSALASKAGFTVEVAAQQGFVANERIVKNYLNELAALLGASPAVNKAVSGASSINEAVKAVNGRTLKAISNKAIANLKEKLEVKANEYFGRVIEDGIIQYGGVLGYAQEGMTDNHISETYAYALLTEVVALHVKDYELDQNIHTMRLLTNHVLKEQAIHDAVYEFQDNFCSGLATVGQYQLGLGTKYFNITKQEGFEHQNALFETLKAKDLAGKYGELLAERVKGLIAERAKNAESIKLLKELEEKAFEQAEQKALEAIEEVPVVEEQTKEEVAMTTEETVTITLAEYNTLLSMEQVNSNYEGLMDEAVAKIKTLENGVVGLDAQLTIKDSMIEKLTAENNSFKTKMEEMVKTMTELRNELKETKEAVKAANKEVKTDMTQFKLNIDDLTKVEARPTKDGKVTTKEEVKDFDLGTFMNARITTVDAGKKATQKVRETAPKATIKVANATHTGIDKVATVAHKTTNVVAKATNTTVLKSANLIDSLFDAVAPTQKAVDSNVFTRTKQEAKDGDVVEINGHKYKYSNGRLMVL